MNQKMLVNFAVTILGGDLGHKFFGSGRCQLARPAFWRRGGTDIHRQTSFS
jgi:hypothetical protein